jgi:chromosome segregation ATPase
MQEEKILNRLVDVEGVISKFHEMLKNLQSKFIVYERQLLEIKETVDVSKDLKTLKENDEELAKKFQAFVLDKENYKKFNDIEIQRLNDYLKNIKSSIELQKATFEDYKEKSHSDQSGKGKKIDDHGNSIDSLNHKYLQVNELMKNHDAALQELKNHKSEINLKYEQLKSRQDKLDYINSQINDSFEKSKSSFLLKHEEFHKQLSDVKSNLSLNISTLSNHVNDKISKLCQKEEPPAVDLSEVYKYIDEIANKLNELSSKIEDISLKMSSQDVLLKIMKKKVESVNIQLNNF